MKRSGIPPGIGSDTLLLQMQVKNKYVVVELASLNWPSATRIPSRRFRLFVAANTTSSTTEAIGQFANAALKAGMVYFSAWGPGCERFHDLVDEVIVADNIASRLFTGPNKTDTIMTTWHQHETLDEACDFFINLGAPTAGFEADSYYWVAICVNNSQWAATMRRKLELAD